MKEGYAYSGIVIACVCVSLNFFVHAITHHTFQHQIAPKKLQILVKFPTVFGVD